ncbi:MAG: translation initiation factor IF-2 [Candidatus Jordarchaeum sp.]|uniref:translation initiation factor IF-2 n=1 Tax=Candidatus Jordarchaeum sp. TaxID=2823881 RepID=UPI004049D44E
MHLRQPICVVLGHIDSGKTSILDKIRGTAVQKREAKGITQHIGASMLDTETIKAIGGDLIKTFNVSLTIPGILMIDVPGHQAFFNLRRRGGAVADFAILVVDVLSGFQAQTYECVDILRTRKTPFLIAANKVDRINGWVQSGSLSILKSLGKQPDFVLRFLDERIYELIGDLSRLGFSSDRFDRVRDFTRNIAIIPTSAITGEGIAELLVVLAGLAQQHLAKRLEVSEGPAKGVALEVKEEPGLGHTVDAIIYDGVLHSDDLIVFGGLGGAVDTRIRALLLPKPLDEMRDPRQRFDSVDEVVAAAGVKIVGQDLERVVAGAPLRVVDESSNLDEVVKEVQADVDSVRIETSKSGVVLKADTLGSLEALVVYFRERGGSVRLADVGDVSKRDIVEAAVVHDKEPLNAVVLAFNVRVLPDAEEEAEVSGIPIFQSDVIYGLFDDYDAWVVQKKEEERRQALAGMVRPFKIKILPGYVFRRSKPAVVGVEVLAGSMVPKVRLVNEENRRVGVIMQIQDEGEVRQIAHRGSNVAISVRGPTVGRQIREGDVLYSDIPEVQIDKLSRDLGGELSPDELEVLNEIKEFKRKKLFDFD